MKRRVLTLRKLRNAKIDYYELKAGALGYWQDLEYLQGEWGDVSQKTITAARKLYYILEGVTGCMTQDFDRDFYNEIVDIPTYQQTCIRAVLWDLMFWH